MTGFRNIASFVFLSAKQEMEISSRKEYVPQYRQAPSEQRRLSHIKILAPHPSTHSGSITNYDDFRLPFMFYKIVQKRLKLFCFNYCTYTYTAVPKICAAAFNSHIYTLRA